MRASILRIASERGLEVDELLLDVALAAAKAAAGQPLDTKELEAIGRYAVARGQDEMGDPRRLLDLLHEDIDRSGLGLAIAEAVSLGPPAASGPGQTPSLARRRTGGAIVDRGPSVQARPWSRFEAASSFADHRRARR